MNNIRAVANLSEQELQAGIFGGLGTASWHEKYRDSAWVYLGGFSFELSEGDLICVMSQWGEIEDINLVREKDTNKSKGFAFIKYEDQKSTILAVDNFNGVKLLGRTMRCDHVDHYRLPKEVREKEQQALEAIDAADSAAAIDYREQVAIGPGHAYKGKELATEHNIDRGVDVWGAAPKTTADSNRASTTAAAATTAAVNASNGDSSELLQRKKKEEKRAKKEQKRALRKQEKKSRKHSKRKHRDESDGEKEKLHKKHRRSMNHNSNNSDGSNSNSNSNSDSNSKGGRRSNQSKENNNNNNNNNNNMRSDQSDGVSRRSEQSQHQQQRDKNNTTGDSTSAKAAAIGISNSNSNSFSNNISAPQQYTKGGTTLSYNAPVASWRGSRDPSLRTPATAVNSSRQFITSNSSNNYNSSNSNINVPNGIGGFNRVR